MRAHLQQVTVPLGVGCTRNKFAQPPDHRLKDGVEDQGFKPSEG